MKRFGCLLLCALLICAVGCAKKEDGLQTIYAVYCKANMDYAGGKDSVYVLKSEVEGENCERIASTLLQKMIEAQGDRYESPMPIGTSVLNVKIEGDLATVNLSEEYADLSGIDLTMADSCITLTLCQIGTVERVQILVEGNPLPYRDRQIISDANVLLSHMDDEMRLLRVRLYFLDTDTNELSSEIRKIQMYEGQSKAEALLEALLAGPRSAELTTVIPKSVEIRSVQVDAGICYVNLSKKFIENIPDSMQEQQIVIYSLVKSLCSVSDVEAVQIAVEGETISYYGSVDISSPLS